MSIADIKYEPIANHFIFLFNSIDKESNRPVDILGSLNLAPTKINLFNERKLSIKSSSEVIRTQSLGFSKNYQSRSFIKLNTKTGSLFDSHGNQYDSYSFEKISNFMGAPNNFKKLGNVTNGTYFINQDGIIIHEKTGPKSGKTSFVSMPISFEIYDLISLENGIIAISYNESLDKINIRNKIIF